jgi:type I restriction enzyme, S subunit
MTSMGRWDIPDTWVWARAVEFSIVVGGATPKNAKDLKNYAVQGIPWITPADLSGYKATHIARGRRDLSAEGFASCSARTLPKGTVLLSSRAPVGYCVVASNDICTNQGFKSLVLRGRELSSEYLRYYLIGSKQYLESEASGTTFLELSGGRVEQLLFPIAPVDEQSRIVSKIDELFSRIEEGERALERVRKLVERYRQSVLKAAVTGELTRAWREQRKGQLESGEALLKRILKVRREAWEQAELGKMKAKGVRPADDKWKLKYQEPAKPEVAHMALLPEGWVWASPVQLEARIPNALAIGPFGSNLKVTDYCMSGVPLIFVRNIRSQSFEATKFVAPEKAAELSSHTARAGDVLITKMGDPPGDACTYPMGFPDAIITADCIKWTLHSLMPSSGYVVTFVNSSLGRSQFADITKGVAQQKVSLDRFRQLGIAVPGAEEQREIAERTEIELQRLNGVSSAIDKELLRAQALRQCVLRAAFSGQLVAQNDSNATAQRTLSRPSNRLATSTA